MDRPFVIIEEMNTTIKQDLTELMDFFGFFKEGQTILKNG